MRPLKNRAGFTMTEMMIVITIVAVMAGLAVPGYFSTVEQSRANEALATLNIIHMGQKIYRLNNASFWAGGNNATVAAIDTALNVDISPIYYTDIDFTAVGANGYTCTLTRNAVQGGGSSRWYQYRWNETTKTLERDGTAATGGVGGNF